MDINENGESDEANGDGEGVWSPEIEQAFQEALVLFPPCGRRKHILQEEGGGKMYGRNELIARYIYTKTGKKRTRKQVSSHIQVLARRKVKERASQNGSAGVSPSPNSLIGRPKSENSRQGQLDEHLHHHLHHHHPAQLMTSAIGGPNGAAYYDIWADRPIVTQKIRLAEFSAFIEHRNFQPPMPTTTNNLNGYLSITSNSSPTPALNVVAAISNADQNLTLNHHSSLDGSANNDPIQQTVAYQQHQAALNNNHVLSSNHHLPAQYNQATSYQTNPPNISNYLLGSTNNQSHPANATNFIRHSYVKIDYRRPVNRQQANKLERIDIREIQDKFPGIGGPDGLFQRGPPDAFFLVKFWADLDNDFEYNIEDQNSYFGFSSQFETADLYKDITCSTKACSYGLQVVEKVEKIYRDNNSPTTYGGLYYSYTIDRSPMCEFMTQFIKKLRQLPRVSQMNSVLENFTVLQVITCEATSEILLCIAYVFEVASTDHHNGPQYNVYKLIKD